MQRVHRILLPGALQSTLGILMVLMVASGCAKGKAMAPETAGAGSVPRVSKALLTTATPAAFSKVRFVGRVAFTQSGQAQYAWSGAGFVVRFRGHGLALQMDDSGNQHTIVVDGAVRPKLVTQDGRRRYVIADHLKWGEHQVELYRRTEAMFGVTALVALEVLGGELVAPQQMPQRHIEIVGDSITCGYGDEGSYPQCRFSADTENHYLAYGAHLARHFGATLSTVAWSGRGVVQNYHAMPGDLMPVLYKRILPERDDALQSSPVPADLVIINLGTNDFNSEPDPADEKFISGYLELLAEVRRLSPSAYVLTTIGPMLGDDDLERAERCIIEAVKRRNLSGDQRIGYHKLRATNDQPGCDWHPSVRTHEIMAQELAEPVARALGW